jgi:hypothetical protein
MCRKRHGPSRSGGFCACRVVGADPKDEKVNSELPKESPATRMTVYSSEDEELLSDTYCFGDGA